jgi:hypothetical protein
MFPLIEVDQGKEDFERIDETIEGLVVRSGH